ncbi:MAG TPA: GNAT family N-acetyltransferase [Bryobacteraceae bacterium]|nr:GNAT family N-acetyltransferase [Bryobacteraceae bacterium]
MRGFETMEANLRATLGVFSLARPDGETRSEPGLALISSGVNYSMFNAALLTEPVSAPAALRRCLERAEAYFSAKRLPWSLWLCTDWLREKAVASAERECAAAGMHFVTDLPGMSAEALKPPCRALPRLEWRRVSDRETREDFTRIMCHAFGVPYSVAHQIYESERTWRGGLAGYVGYHGNFAVTSSAVFAEAGVAGLYAVGTLPAHQRKGYAEAMLRIALEDSYGQAGITATVLQSSAAGHKLYQRLGYRDITRYWVFART